MMHGYDQNYLDLVMHNLAALFDIAINTEGLSADGFGEAFASSRVARGIERGDPDLLAGKSAPELLMLITDRDVGTVVIPPDRSPEYWAGWVLAFAQWQLNKTFKEILAAVPFSRLIALYHPYHEADEMKTVALIQSKLSRLRTT